MIPHEKALVKRLEGRPFAFIGVNSDPADTVRKLCEENAIPWRNAVEGSTRARIPTEWNVRSWPTIYVLDAKGVIRFKNVRGQGMDEAVDELLSEMPR